MGSQRDQRTRQVRLRVANPTLDEGRVFARYLDQAAEGFFRFWLGHRVVEILAEAFVEPDHDLSWKNVTFAESNEAIVGMVSGYTAERHRRSSDLSLRRAAGRWNLRMKVLMVLLAPLFRILDSVDDGDYYLQAIAVDEDVRGSGIGSALMDTIEDRALASGSARLVLDVSGANNRARQFYERRGMTVESQWPKRLVIPGLRLVRMIKTVEAPGT